MTTHTLGGDKRRVRPYTVKDIAKLAGVSTATVSRVVNGSGIVSRTTKTKVLIAITKVRYSPNTHAAQLGRGNRGIPRARATPAGSSDTAAKLTSDPTAGGLDKRPAAGQLDLLEDENSRLRRLIADLRLDLESLKGLPSSADRQ